MTSKRLALVVSVVALGACGVARPQGPVLHSVPTAVESRVATTGEARTAATEVSSAPMTVAEPDETEPGQVGTGRTTTPTTRIGVDPTSTTTNPAGSIDLAEVREALDGLDELLGDLDGHIGTVDLDEGETP